jgi:hypothetical protein
MKKNRNERQESAKGRLVAQLAAGTKTEKKTNKVVALTDGDIKRINKEIAILSK